MKIYILNRRTLETESINCSTEAVLYQLCEDYNNTPDAYKYVFLTEKELKALKKATTAKVKKQKKNTEAPTLFVYKSTKQTQ
jgi:hypothetical protein